MSLLTLNLDNGLTTAGLSLAPLGSLFSQSGVLKATSFRVRQLGSPGMFVEVTGSTDDDIAIIKTADGATYYVKNTLTFQVPILANSTGVTKTDAIVLYVDLTAGDAANAGSPGSAHVIAVRRAGVSTGTPTNGEIDAATSNNPWLKLREVTVIHGESLIDDTKLSYSPARAPLEGGYLKALSVETAAIKDGAVSAAKLATAAARMKIAEITVSSASPSITFSSIPSGYKNLVLTWTAKNSASTPVSLILRLNGDNGTNYYGQLIRGNNTTASASQTIAATEALIGAIAGSTAGANVFNSGQVTINNYANTAFEKQLYSQAMRLDGKSSGNLYLDLYGTHWANTAAITSLTVLAGANNLVVGSTFTLYGDP